MERLKLVLTLFFAAQTLCLGEDVLQFIAMGDFGIDKVPGEVDSQMIVAEQMAAWANVTNLNFIMTLGDNFYPVGAFSVEDEQFDSKWRDVYIKPHPSLRVDWQIVLGNHDHYLDNGKNMLEFAKVEPLWNIPNYFYTFTKTIGSLEALFVVVDTEMIYLTSNKPEQLRFLNSTLRQSNADWKFVAAHHPLFSTAMHGNHVELINDMRPILMENNVDFYLFGHDHVMQHLTGPSYDTVDYVGSGGGGQIPTIQIPEHVEELKQWNVTLEMYNRYNAFVGITLTKTRAQVDYIKDSGELFYSFTRNK